MRTDRHKKHGEKFTISASQEGNRIDECVLLLDRMEQLIHALSPHQRDYHLVSRVDIYWYIQKQKEVEILANRLLQNSNEMLTRYLFSVYEDILKRIDGDEQFAREYLTATAGKAFSINFFGPDQLKPPDEIAGPISPVR